MDYLGDVIHGNEQDNPSGLRHLTVALKIERRQIDLAVSKHRFWYVDIPRTSSTSVQQAVGSKFGYPFGKEHVSKEVPDQWGMRAALLPVHTPSFIAQKVIGDELWDDIRTFSIVRHPLTWAVSFWQYMKTYYAGDFCQYSFNKFLLHLAHLTDLPVTHRTFLPMSYLQSDYLFCPVTGARLVQEVFNFEDRTGIDDWMTANLGIKPDNAMKLMATDAKDIEISAEDEALARNVLSKDFELLGYS